MKKRLLIVLVAIVLIAPIAAKAQTVDTSQMSNNELRTYLISLIEEVINLEQQLIVMQNLKPTVIENPAIVVPPAQPQATTTQAPIEAGAPAPQPSGYKIQIIAWPGPVNQIDRAFVASSTLEHAYDDTTDNSHVDLGAILMNPSGKAVNDATIEIITTDPNQNTEIIGTGNVYGNPAVPYYAFSYVFKTIGSHTITFTAMGATQSITLQAQ